MVTAGLAIYDTMQFIKPDVSTMWWGRRPAWARVLLAAGAKGKRYSLPHSRVMIHQPLGGFQGQATDIDIHAREILKIREQLNELLASHTGSRLRPSPMIPSAITSWAPDMAKDYGLIDHVLDTQQARSEEIKYRFSSIERIVRTALRKIATE